MQPKERVKEVLEVTNGHLWDDLTTLRKSWKETIEHDGGHCPVCDRWGKVYARGINATMAQSLVWLSQAHKDEHGWVDVPNTAPRWLVRSNQLPTLKWWKLVERRANTEESANKYSGMWRVTELGSQFVSGAVSVPKRVFTYNNVVEGFSEEHVFIRDCGFVLFNYPDVMQTQFKG